MAPRTNRTAEFSPTRRRARADEFPTDVLWRRVLSQMHSALPRFHVLLEPCAAMKHVDICEREPMECAETNVGGAKNVIKACLENNVAKVVALSTDKAVNPINHYGASKLCSDKMFLGANNYARKIGWETDMHTARNIKQEFCVVRYGNVMGSNGSVIPKWVKLAKQGKPLPITDPEMTRFMMTIEQACDMVLNAKVGMNIAKAPSMEMGDLADAVWSWVHPNTIHKETGLNINPTRCMSIGIRAGEKLHEQLDEGYFSNTNNEWMSPETLKEWLDEQYRI